MCGNCILPASQMQMEHSYLLQHENVALKVRVPMGPRAAAHPPPHWSASQRHATPLQARVSALESALKAQSASMVSCLEESELRRCDRCCCP